MIKAVFLDVDGTIISIRTHTIPQSAAEAIHKARFAGIKVFLCTSRAKQFLSNIKAIECDGIVALTGAHCIDSEGNDISTMPMSPSDIANAITDVQKRGKELVLVSSGKVYMENFGKKINEYLGTGGLTLADIPGVSKLPDFLNAEDPVSLAESLGILQVTGFFPSGEEDRRFLGIMPDSHTERWTEAFVDIVGNGISKALGIDVMARHFGFDVSETMGIGDGANDIPMIEHAAIGVAMGNASDYVKAHADFVTDDVDDDGLSKAFEKFLNF